MWYYNTVMSEILSDQQSAFVSALVRDGCNATEAARRAGYAQPKQRAYELLRKPHVLQAIRDEQARLLDGDLANVALRTLREVMESESSPASARVAASRAVLEASGYFKRGKEGQLAEEDILDMSEQELESFIAKGRETIARLSQAVGHA